jgi:predicted transcriptional regulator of viral defense system
MPRKSQFDTRRLSRILQEQHSVISRAQVMSCGMSRSALHLRIASSGPWQRILPGVYLAVTGGMTEHQREMAALLYAGPASLITGPAAARRHGLRSPGPDVVDLLIPARSRRQSAAFVRVHRTERMPQRMVVTGKVRFAEASRAVPDAARFLTRFDDVRAVVCDAVQRRACTGGRPTMERPVALRG